VLTTNVAISEIPQKKEAAGAGAGMGGGMGGMGGMGMDM
jgi:chaperonin GroEL